MDRHEQVRIEQLNREAALEKKPGDPMATEPRDAQPLIVMICIGLAIAVVALGLMWVNNSRYDGISPEPVAERSEPAAPKRQ